MQIVFALVLLASLGYLAWFSIRQSSNHPEFTAMVADVACKHVLVRVVLSPSVMTESESRELTLIVNSMGRSELRPAGVATQQESKQCIADIDISAPAFDHEPHGEVRRIALPPGDENRSLTWVIAPTRRGQQLILIQSGLDQIRVPITVTSNIGLTAAQTAWAAAISSVVAFIGLIFATREALSKFMDSVFGQRRKQRRR